MKNVISRRELLGGAAAAGLSLSPMTRMLMAEEPERMFKLGACDWSIGKYRTAEAFEVAKAIGLDGVEVSFGRPGKNDLRDEAVRKQFQEAAKKSEVEICSLAMGVLNGVPYATSDEAERWVEECVEVMPKVGVKVVLMAFFAKGDIRGKRDLQDAVIKRLKKVAPKAEKAGVILGVESWLNAEDHLRIIGEVDSPAVKIYYDVANMTYSEYDVPKEIRRIGRERICQIHMKENGCLLGKGKVDFPAVRDAINEIEYDGWLIIEGAVEPGRGIKDCYVDNRKYLENLFAKK